MSLNLTIARDGVEVTPSATTVFSPPLNGLWIGGLGDVQVVTPNGTTLVFSAVPAGTLLPIQAKQVLAAATTATLINGFK